MLPYSVTCDSHLKDENNKLDTGHFLFEMLANRKVIRQSIKIVNSKAIFVFTLQKCHYNWYLCLEVM